MRIAIPCLVFLLKLAPQARALENRFKPSPSAPTLPGSVGPSAFRPGRVALADRIFLPRLVADLQRRYEEKFGSIITSRVAYAFPIERQPVLDFDRLEEMERYESESKATQDYGIYVVRRTMEFHLDRSLRDEPETKPIFEMKERLTNNSLPLGQGVRLDLRYSISGQFASARLTNPWLPIEGIFDLARETDGPRREGRETTLRIERRLTDGRRIRAYYKFVQEVMSLIVSKDSGLGFVTSITASSYIEDATDTREALLLFGVAWGAVDYSQ